MGSPQRVAIHQPDDQHFDLEDPRGSGAAIYVAYRGDLTEEFIVSPAAGSGQSADLLIELLRELENRYGLKPIERGGESA